MATGELIAPSPPGVTPKRCPGCGREGEWSGQPCPLCKDGAVPLDANSRNIFDPIGLRELATHLRDQRWLDMHVDDERGKLAKRVKLTAIIVRTTDELVSARQEWVDGGDEEPRFNHQDLVFNAEAIWRVQSPTLFPDIDGLRPFGLEDFQVKRSKPAEERPREVTHNEASGDDRFIFDHVCTHVAAKYGCTMQDVADSNGGRLARWAQARYDAMLLVHDMTQLTDLAVAHLFNYKSITPFHSARHEIKPLTSTYATNELKQERLKRRSEIRKLAQQIDLTLASAQSRREPPESREVL